MEWLLIAWGIVTGILLLLLFYRSTLTRQEDDQLFIDESSSSRATEQSQLIAKVNRINPLVKMVGATSGLMILAIAGWAVYIGLNSVQPTKGLSKTAVSGQSPGGSTRSNRGTLVNPSLRPYDS